MRKYLIFSVLLFVSGFSFSQEITIMGKVLDSKGLAIPELTVKVLSGENLVNGALTDEKGFFYISFLESGTYNIEIEPFCCYLKKQIKEVRVVDGKMSDLGIIQLQNPENAIDLSNMHIIEFKNPPMTKTSDDVLRDCTMKLKSREITICGTRDIKTLKSIAPNLSDYLVKRKL